MTSRYAVAMALSCAVHLALAALLAGLPARVLPPGGVRPDRIIEVFNATPPEDPRFAGLNPVDRSHDEWTRPQGAKASNLHIGDLTIDVEKIRGRAMVLFPFVTPGLSLDLFLPGPRTLRRSALQNPLVSARRPQKPGVHGPLALSEAKLQSVVDKSWSRRDRWDAFRGVAQLAQVHDADTGQLPSLFQKYRDQNSLQPYAEAGSRDPRLWVQLGIAADHVEFIAFIRRFASEHPSTRATTELLFLLDKLAEANADALDVLRDSDPELLAWTRQTNLDAYRLINGIRGYYERELQRLGLTSDAAIDRFYDKGRLAILEGILRTTPQGYRANDARFLIGAIHWRQQNVERALDSWREMTTADRDDSYLVPGSQIVTALRGFRRDAGSRAAIDPYLRREIDRILKNEQGRWVMFSYDRLRQFGYRFDSF